MSWFNTEGRDPQHVIYSKTSYTRNLSGLPFTARLGEKNSEAIFKKIDAILTKNGFSGEEIPAGDSISALSLAEKGFVDGGFIFSKTKRKIYFNEPCSLSVAIGGRDIISISSLLSGSALLETRNIASGAENLLDDSLEFAYAEGTGYISSIPSLCGSGVAFSALLYLPAISTGADDDTVKQACFESGVSILPAFTYAGGDLYVLTYSPPHLSDEAAAAESFGAFIRAVTERENELETIIYNEKRKIITDRAWKAYGQLYYARTLSESEMLSLASEIRIAICLCDGNAKLPPVTVTDLNRMIGEYLNASCALLKPGCGSDEDICRARAELISAMLSSVE